MAREWIVVAVLLGCSAVIQAGRLLGGRRTASTDSPGVQDALSFALYEFNKVTNDMYAARAVNIKNVETQVVAGTMYYIDADIRRTKCRKPIADVSSCDFHTDPELSKVSSCHFEVLVVPWTHTSTMTKHKCH